MERLRPGSTAEVAGPPARRAARLAELNILLADMEATPAGFGGWRRETRAAKGDLHLPTVDLSAAARSFIVGVRDTGLIISSFDWVAWDKRGQYMHDPSSVDVADFHECRKLLTALVRGDRFNEGLLLEAFDCGLLRRLIDRFISLTAV